MIDNKLKSADKLPGSYGLPFIGEAIEQFSTKQLFYWKRYQRYGSLFKTLTFGRKIAVLVGKEANQLVLKDEADKFSSKIGWSFLEPLFGSGILLQDGLEHKNNRKLMFPAFHGHAIESYIDIVHKIVRDYLKNWSFQAPFPIFDSFRKLSLTIAFQLMLGVMIAEDIDKLSFWFLDYVDGLRTVFRFDTPWSKYGRALSARHNLEEYIRQIIKSRHNSRISNNSQDILGILLTSKDEYGNQLSESEIVTQIIQLLFGAHDSVAKILTWTIFELARHPNWGNLLREEQVHFVGENWIKVEHLKLMKLLNCVINEVERLYPPSYAIPRGVISDVVFSGYLIPAGWYVQVSPLLTHRLPELFPNPHHFDPERFLPPREEHKQHSFALIPFGGGIHQCLGKELAQMEIKITVSEILRQFDWKVTPELSANIPVLQPGGLDRNLQLHVKHRS
jgi:cytochrome P450